MSFVTQLRNRLTNGDDRPTHVCVGCGRAFDEAHAICVECGSEQVVTPRR